jgi:hypothetical protein
MKTVPSGSSVAECHVRGCRSAPRSVSDLFPSASLKTTADCGPSRVSPPTTSQRPSGRSVAVCPSPTAGACAAAALLTGVRAGALRAEATRVRDYGAGAFVAAGDASARFLFFVRAAAVFDSSSRHRKTLAAGYFFILSLRLV